MGTERTTVLVTGGAGYIGSHAVWALVDAGWPVVVLDDLSTGVAANLPPEVPLVVGSTGDRDRVAQLVGAHRIGAVLHFAASVVVPESVADPLRYYANNTLNTHALVQTLLAHGVKDLIFSSTAAVYGDGPGDGRPLDEAAPTRPINPYGRSKLMSEWMLQDAAAAHGLRCVVLRYFNVAGADPRGRTGQSTPRATHLIKAACEAATGRRPVLKLFGTDYPTPDGSCVRDYIHVSDLAEAHVRALEHLQAGGANLTLNCGYGRGASVRQVIAAVERAAGAPLPVEAAPRRPGDPAALVADAARIRQALDWTPRHDSLDTIVQTALAWERRMAEPATMAAQ